jgi:hypothetical protein
VCKRAGCVARRQEDGAHTKAFTSAAATISCEVATIRSALPQYERSWDKYDPWAEDYDAQKKVSQDSAMVEAAKRPWHWLKGRSQTTRRQPAMCRT